ncbi:ATP-binding protein [Qipengyuania sp. XHP0211]|uniref:ATP-binding protein n=1 Tax=Qipengyuania sp. XHP0211 TaxID=3038079 RepID=UPI00241CC92A|nr:ATP-binding protein [Qipengyuania sp. XHP0211]MDG5750930.1 ATP-binding protein [Qipengyuania sp. XHP0211]
MLITPMLRMIDQPTLPFWETPPEHRATWTSRDLWLRLSEHNLAEFSEDDRIERKSASKVDRRRYAEYLSMWANTVEGGIMLFGVENNGAVTGCASLSQPELNALKSCHTQLCPEASPEFRTIGIEVDGKPNFVVAAYIPYRGTLVETHKAEAFIRHGDNKHRMSAEERDDFRATRQERRWEQRPNEHFKFPQDFDENVVQEFCTNFRERENKPDWSTEDILVDRHLMIKDGDRYVPLNCLTLFAAKDPLSFHAGARIRVQRFEGTEEGAGETFSPLRDFYLEGNIPRILREGDTMLANMNYNVTWLSNEGKFVTTPEYPKWAWFEALVNALVHRSYSFSGSEIFVKFFSDRMEVESPGGFVPPVNAANIYNQRAARNPHLMEALRYLGFTQMSREGTRRMRQSMEDYNLPAPNFSQEAINGVSVRVTLRNDHHTRKRALDKDVATYCGVDTWKQLQEYEVQIMGYAFNNRSIQVAEASRITGRTWNTSKKDLDRLVRKGLLAFVPPKFQRDPKARYELVGDRRGGLREA